MGLGKSLCYQRLVGFIIKKKCENPRFAITTSESLTKTNAYRHQMRVILKETYKMPFTWDKGRHLYCLHI